MTERVSVINLPLKVPKETSRYRTSGRAVCTKYMGLWKDVGESNSRLDKISLLEEKGKEGVFLFST
jgi:hypothetical protein